MTDMVRYVSYRVTFRTRQMWLLRMLMKNHQRFGGKWLLLTYSVHAVPDKLRLRWVYEVCYKSYNSQSVADMIVYYLCRNISLLDRFVLFIMFRVLGTRVEPERGNSDAL